MAVMEVESNSAVKSLITSDEIIEFLVRNEDIFFKSQQRGESDLTKEEKTAIALEILEKSKSNFLLRFGKYLQKNHLQFFESFKDDPNVEVIIRDLQRFHSETAHQKDVRNRRYEALKEMLAKDTYFSETEMMKRNPLLYEQLVGKYLSEDEKRERDRFSGSQCTIVNILLEGIERDESDCRRLREKSQEDDAMEEEEDDDDDDDEKDAETGEVKPVPLAPAKRDVSQEAGHSLWGEMKDDYELKINQKAYCGPIQEPIAITEEERLLLKKEFVSTMYQQFLDGKDVDFDYEAVDNDTKYDDLDTLDLDEEEKYFDSEDPEIVEPKEESSEDELDIHMNGLNQHPSVVQLSNDMNRL